MAYIGKEPIVGNFQVCDAISVVNGQAAYTMQVSSTNVSPESANHMLVSLNGVIQKPGSSFTISGATITFASNLATGDVIDFIILLGHVLDIGTPSDNTVATAKIADDAVTAAKINNDIISGTTALATAPADTDEFLVSDAGTLKRIDYSLIKAAPVWSFIKSVTASGAASVEFANGSSDVVLDSTYIMYKVIAYDITVTGDDSNTQLQFSTDAGSSWITSGYDTIINRIRSDAANANGASTTDAMNLNSVGNSTNEECGFEFTLLYPSSGSTYAKYWFDGITRDQSARVGHHDGGGMYEATSDIDGIRVLQNSGNLSGTFKLYGLKGS